MSANIRRTTLPFSWRQFGSNYRASSASYIHSAISRIVIEDINDSVRQAARNAVTVAPTAASSLRQGLQYALNRQ